MKVSITKEIQGKYDALIIPFVRDTALKTSLSGLDPVASEVEHKPGKLSCHGKGVQEL